MQLPLRNDGFFSSAQRQASRRLFATLGEWHAVERKGCLARSRFCCGCENASKIHAEYIDTSENAPGRPSLKHNTACLSRPRMALARWQRAYPARRHGRGLLKRQTRAEKDTTPTAETGLASSPFDAGIPPPLSVPDTARPPRCSRPNLGMSSSGGQRLYQYSGECTLH